MASYGTVIQQGKFTSDGTTRTIALRSDVDSMHVYNYTQMTATNDVGVQYYWQRGMAAATGISYFKSGGGTLLNGTVLAAPTGFTLVDTSAVTLSAGVVITNISNAATPRITAVGHGLNTGDIVRISNAVGAAQLGGIDFRVTRIDANNYDLSWMAQVAAAAAPGATAVGRKVSSESLYIPRSRNITKITAAAQAVVTMAAPHSFTVGQAVRFKMPVVSAIAYGMTELDNLIGNIVAISTANNTITVDIDTSGFTAFAFPLTAAGAFTPAQVVPIGMDTAVALANTADILADQVRNTGEIGIILAGGASSPGGADTDVMYWVASKALSVSNS